MFERELPDGYVKPKPCKYLEDCRPDRMLCKAPKTEMFQDDECFHARDGEECSIALRADEMSSCPHSNGEFCASYSGCHCRECSSKHECTDIDCGEICACRTDEEENFKPKGEAK